HPNWSAKYNTVTTNEERSIAGINADYTFNSWVKVNYSIGSNVHTLKRAEVTEISSRAAEGKGRLVREDYRRQEIESNLFFTINPSSHSDYTLRTVVGYNYNRRTTQDLVQTGNQFITRGIHTLTNTKNQEFTDDFYSKRVLMGIYGDLTLGY